MHPGTIRSLVLTAAQLLAALLAVAVLGAVLPQGIEGTEFVAVVGVVAVLMGVNYVYWAIRDGWWLPSVPASTPEDKRTALRQELAERRSGEGTADRRDGTTDRRGGTAEQSRDAGESGDD